MAETIIDCPSVAKPVSRPRSSKPAIVSASALALHLDCSRTYIGKLEAEGVIQRQGDGFPLDRSPRCLPAILASREEAVTAGQPASNQIRPQTQHVFGSIGSDLDQRVAPSIAVRDLDYQTVHVLIAISHLRESLRGIRH